MKKAGLAVMIGGLMIASQATSGWSYDINEKLSVEGTLNGVYQYVSFNDNVNIDNTGRGAAAVELGINFHPTEKDEFQLTLSYASGNALNSINPLSCAPYADDLEDDLANGNNLLEAWYKKTFDLPQGISLGLTFGIIDATGYIDDNAFANDELAQFMNEVFVNNPLAGLPSYDIGGVVELGVDSLSVKALMMNTEEDGDNYDYYAFQVGYTLKTPLGEGNYRVYGFATSNKSKDLKGAGISIDQKLTEKVGVFARFGYEKNGSKEKFGSGGVNINGKFWGRESDEAGIGLAYIDPEGDSSTLVGELYAKFQLFEKEDIASDITFDFQYIKNTQNNTDQTGTFYGVRWNVSF